MAAGVGVHGATFKSRLDDRSESERFPHLFSLKFDALPTGERHSSVVYVFRVTGCRLVILHILLSRVVIAGDGVTAQKFIDTRLGHAGECSAVKRRSVLHSVEL